ncbi:MAG: ribonuclease HII [Candidatus Dormibacteraceae bacterium]
MPARLLGPPRTPRRRRARPRFLWASERVARQLGFEVVAGVDEAGRGPLAGPVVAAAVVLPWRTRLPGIRDGKLLSPAQRRRYDELIRGQAVAVSVASVPAADIDAVGLTLAGRRAMAGAVDGLPLAAQYLLIDAFDLPESELPQLAVVRGDSICISIMAAGIVAKVARDREMLEFDRLYPGYGFAEHKGYATASHRAALRRLGPSPIHRVSWAPFRRPPET